MHVLFGRGSKMEYQWDLTRVYVKDIGSYKDVICGFDAQMTCRDEHGRYGFYEVFIPIDTLNLSSNFIEINNLTRETVRTWADNSFTTEELDNIKSQAAKKCSIWNSKAINKPFGCKWK